MLSLRSSVFRSPVPPSSDARSSDKSLPLDTPWLFPDDDSWGAVTGSKPPFLAKCLAAFRSSTVSSAPSARFHLPSHSFEWLHTSFALHSLLQ